MSLLFLASTQRPGGLVPACHEYEYMMQAWLRAPAEQRHNAWSCNSCRGAGAKGASAARGVARLRLTPSARSSAGIRPRKCRTPHIPHTLQMQRHKPLATLAVSHAVKPHIRLISSVHGDPDLRSGLTPLQPYLLSPEASFGEPRLYSAFAALGCEPGRGATLEPAPAVLKASQASSQSRLMRFWCASF